MKLMYLPLLIASFAVTAEDKLNLETLEANSLVSDGYIVTISIEDEDQYQQSLTHYIVPNVKAAFGTTKSQEYINEISTTYKWYHTFFGIEPESVPHYGTFKTGFEGSVNVTEVSKNQVYVDFQSSYSKLIEIEKLGDVEAPNLKTRKMVNKATVNLDKNNGCFQPYVGVEVCISKA